jgi:hypothetical protein
MAAGDVRDRGWGPLGPTGEVVPASLSAGAQTCGIAPFGRPRRNPPPGCALCIGRWRQAAGRNGYGGGRRPALGDSQEAELSSRLVLLSGQLSFGIAAALLPPTSGKSAQLPLAVAIQSGDFFIDIFKDDGMDEWRKV